MKKRQPQNNLLQVSHHTCRLVVGPPGYQNPAGPHGEAAAEGLWEEGCTEPLGAGTPKASDGSSLTARGPARIARWYTLPDPELAEHGQAARGLCGWQIEPGGSRHRALGFPGPGRAQPESCWEATGWLSCWGPPPHPHPSLLEGHRSGCSPRHFAPGDCSGLLPSLLLTPERGPERGAAAEALGAGRPRASRCACTAKANQGLP